MKNRRKGFLDKRSDSYARCSEVDVRGSSSLDDPFSISRVDAFLLEGVELDRRHISSYCASFGSVVLNQRTHGLRVRCHGDHRLLDVLSLPRLLGSSVASHSLLRLEVARLVISRRWTGSPSICPSPSSCSRSSQSTSSNLSGII